jgi:hypothetical protein
MTTTDVTCTDCGESTDEMIASGGHFYCAEHAPLTRADFKRVNIRGIPECMYCHGRYQPMYRNECLNCYCDRTGMEIT